MSQWTNNSLSTNMWLVTSSPISYSTTGQSPTTSPSTSPSTSEVSSRRDGVTCTIFLLWFQATPLLHQVLISSECPHPLPLRITIPIHPSFAIPGMKGMSLVFRPLLVLPRLWGLQQGAPTASLPLPVFAGGIPSWSPTPTRKTFRRISQCGPSQLTSW